MTGYKGKNSFMESSGMYIHLQLNKHIGMIKTDVAIPSTGWVFNRHHNLFFSVQQTELNVPNTMHEMRELRKVRGKKCFHRTRWLPCLYFYITTLVNLAAAERKVR
jgi:hypothetical protein